MGECFGGAEKCNPAVSGDNSLSASAAIVFITTASVTSPGDHHYCRGNRLMVKNLDNLLGRVSVEGILDRPIYCESEEKAFELCECSVNTAQTV